MARALAGLFVVALLVPRVDARPGGIRITCEDGGRQGSVDGFGRWRRLAICDLDLSCDGICTVAVLSPRDARCLLVDPRPCELRGPQPTEAADAGADCNRQFPGNGIPVGASRSQRTFFGGRVTVRCRPSGQCTPTTTTTLPPGIPDLTGQWTLIGLDATDDCPAAVESIPAFTRFPEHHTMQLLQDGTRLFHCGSEIFATQFAVSDVTADGFTFDTGECCSVGDGNITLTWRRECLPRCRPKTGPRMSSRNGGSRLAVLRVGRRSAHGPPTPSCRASSTAATSTCSASTSAAAFAASAASVSPPRRAVEA